MPMSTSTPKALPGGIYCPTVTFFLDNAEQELDIPTHSRHMEFLARSGINGVVVQGSTGEAVALNRDERMQMVRTAKEAFTRIGNPGAIIAGTVGAQSTREAIELCRDAASAGADYTLILPPSYYPGAMKPDAIQSFFEDVANASPIPVLIYSYPAVCSGINMDTDLIGRLARHPNIAGVKHTDHDIGKIAREAAMADIGSPFMVLGGATDYLLGCLAVGGKGAITGMANVTPRACAKAYELHLAGRHGEALELAGKISKAEWAMGKGGILGTKHAVVWANGYPAHSALGRKPLPLVSEATKAHVEAEFADIVKLERQLEKEGNTGIGLRSDAPAVGKKDNGTTNGTGLLQSLKETVAAV